MLWSKGWKGGGDDGNDDVMNRVNNNCDYLPSFPPRPKMFGHGVPEYARWDLFRSCAAYDVDFDGMLHAYPDDDDPLRH